MKKPFNYHQQVARLARAQELMRQAQDEITACIDHERDHHQEEGAQEYEGLLVNVEHARDAVDTFKDAVAALAAHQPPDTECDVPGCTLTREQHQAQDPHALEADERLQRMMDDAFDLAKQYSTTPAFVVGVLEAAVAEGDQR